MAQLDDKHLQVTIGIVGVGSAPVDVLVHQGRKMGLGREELEAVPVVRFGLRPVVLERSLVVVMSAAPLDVVQADAVIAIHTGEPGLEELLDRYDLLPLDAKSISTDRLMTGAGREHGPVTLLLNAVGARPLALDGFESGTVDLASGEGLSSAINGLLNRVVGMLAQGTPAPRECPTIILHATHRATKPSDLQPAALPQPGAGLTLRISLHEPFGDDWSCAFAGTTEAVVDPHTVRGTVEPAGPVPDSLAGAWGVEMFREREIWILRSMRRL